MNLGLSIANLLRRYPAVGVPGIGVFRRTRRPASYDADMAAFLPPSDHIELVDTATDVFQLTDYLVAQEKLDGPAAEAKLESAVAAIMDTISRNGEAVLDGLGYLLADGASFMFKPFEVVDGVAAKPIAAQAPVTAVVPAPGTPAAAAGESNEAEQPVAEVAATGELAAVADEGRGGKRYILWIVGGAVAAMLIAAVAIWKYQPAWFHQILAGQLAVTDHGDAVLAEPSHAPVAPVDTASKDSLAADTGLAAADTTLAVGLADSVDQVPEAGAVPPKPSVTYEIIVGSFATMRQAHKYVAEMKAKGYNLYAIDSRMPGNRKKISWGSYATEEEAYRELARVQKTFQPDAWIAKVPHD